MCALFGYLSYKNIVPYKVLKKLTQALANAAEERGTDAAGISYINNDKVVIYKRPKPAHKLHFNPPEGTIAVMGHTRMTTQGNEKFNYNNHPFAGTAGDISFAFAHNGVLWNDHELRKDKLIPDTYIETDSYAACQLIEQQGKLDFDSLKYMAETVEGNFTFTVLDDSNSLYIIKGSNPMCLLHFKDIGLYVYASTESIMKNALRRIGLHKFASERIKTDEGDIIRIDRNGDITRSEFKPAPQFSRFSTSRGWYNDYDDYYSAYEQTLIDMASLYGSDPDEIIMLLEYGYTVVEVEEMLMDNNLLREAVNEIKYLSGEYIYEDCYGIV